jgi:hypothetical protein
MCPVVDGHFTTDFQQLRRHTGAHALLRPEYGFHVLASLLYYRLPGALSLRRSGRASQPSINPRRPAESPAARSPCDDAPPASDFRESSGSPFHHGWRQNTSRLVERLCQGCGGWSLLAVINPRGRGLRSVERGVLCAGGVCGAAVRLLSAQYACKRRNAAEAAGKALGHSARIVTALRCGRNAADNKSAPVSGSNASRANDKPGSS